MKFNDNCGVYKITSPSGKFYIGSSKDIARRWKDHIKDLRKSKHKNIALQRAFDKYGEFSLVFEKIILCPANCLIMYEQISIDGLKPKYNRSPTAGNTLGLKFTDEQKEAKRKTANIQWSDSEFRDKQRKSKKELWSDPAHCAKSASIKLGCDRVEVQGFHVITGKRTPIFASGSEAAKWLRVNGWPRAYGISGRFLNENKAAYGHHWYRHLIHNDKEPEC